MKKGGILHPELLQLVASLGHTDFIVLADKGFPIPDDIKRINLGFAENQPTILEVLKTLSVEMDIDRIIVTNEMEDISPTRLEELKATYPDILFEKVTHNDMKELTAQSKGAVKTGDSCSYANLIVVSG
jgi:D-ribose pyranase